MSAFRMRRTTRPMVRSSFSVGSPTLIVSPTRSLSSTRRRRSRNSAAWKVFSANQRSTTLGRLWTVSIARSAAGRLCSSARRSSNVCGASGWPVRTTMTVALARAATVSASRPNRRRPDPTPEGWADAPDHDQLVVGRLLQDRAAHRRRLDHEVANLDAARGALDEGRQGRALAVDRLERHRPVGRRGARRARRRSPGPDPSRGRSRARRSVRRGRGPGWTPPRPAHAASRPRCRTAPRGRPRRWSSRTPHAAARAAVARTSRR